MNNETPYKTNQELMEEWLAAGNKITVCEPGARTEGLEQGYSWGKPKKKKSKKTNSARKT